MTDKVKLISGFEVSDLHVASDAPDWLRAERESAFEKLAKVEFPTTSDEIWRYSRVDELLSLGLSMDVEPAKIVMASQPGKLPAVFASLAESASLFVNLGAGRARVVATPRSSDVVFCSASQLAEPTWPLSEPSDDFFELFGQANSPDRYVVDVPAGVALVGPIVVLHDEYADGVNYMPHLVVSVGDNASARLIEVFTGGNERSLLGSSTKVHLGASARFEHFQVQDLELGAYQTSFVGTHLGVGASALFGAFSFGGHYARIRSESHLLGDGARAQLKAAYFANGEQMQDFRTLQDHHGPNTYSDLLFKGAVAGKSHSVYSGLVRIEEGAIRSDAFQTNRNLVLSEGARADSVPNLDIRENNVRCSHASAVGPIDPDLIFYLESRGIDPRRAERMIVRGFFKEILEGIDEPELVGIVEALVAKKLEELD